LTVSNFQVADSGCRILDLLSGVTRHWHTHPAIYKADGKPLYPVKNSLCIKEPMHFPELKYSGRPFALEHQQLAESSQKYHAQGTKRADKAQRRAGTEGCKQN
jgi:hypothetical protein